MNCYCLIGHPLQHSISPVIHQRLFELSGFPGIYSLREILPEQFDSQAEHLKSLNGFNVTIPYKQRILPYLSRLSARAKKYGAVNTVKNEGGALCGYNTDAEGFLRALAQAGIELHGDVLLCGAGGAAVMMACEALERGCRLTAAARTIGKAEGFAQNLLCKYANAQIVPAALSNVSGSFDVILNATPSGMYPHQNESPLQAGVAAESKAVFDAVYNPCETLLLKQAKEGNAKVQSGLPMLVWQAAAAQEIWTGARFKAEDIQNLCGEMTLEIESMFQIESD